jgi:hypothetical protein
MITHEEAKKHATIYLPHEEKFWLNYITQQEKKDKLLELYRNEIFRLQDKIETLEEELK